jgi:hypothetical protein
LPKEREQPFDRALLESTSREKERREMHKGSRAYRFSCRSLSAITSFPVTPKGYPRDMKEFPIFEWDSPNAWAKFLQRQFCGQ